MTATLLLNAVIKLRSLTSSVKAGDSFREDQPIRTRVWNPQTGEMYISSCAANHDPEIALVYRNTHEFVEECTPKAFIPGGPYVNLPSTEILHAEWLKQAGRNSSLLAHAEPRAYSVSLGLYPESSIALMNCRVPMPGHTEAYEGCSSTHAHSYLSKCGHLPAVDSGGSEGNQKPPKRHSALSCGSDCIISDTRAISKTCYRKRKTSNVPECSLTSRYPYAAASDMSIQQPAPRVSRPARRKHVPDGKGSKRKIPPLNDGRLYALPAVSATQHKCQSTEKGQLKEHGLSAPKHITKDQDLRVALDPGSSTNGQSNLYFAFSYQCIIVGDQMISVPVYSSQQLQ